MMKGSRDRSNSRTDTLGSTVCIKRLVFRARSSTLHIRACILVLEVVWQNFEIFEILGGAGDIHNSTSIPNYCNEPCNDLGIYVNKVHSAWAEVWTVSYRSSKRFWFPGVVLGRFSRFLRFSEGW